MTEPTNILKWRDGQAMDACTDELAIEEPLEVRVRGRAVSVTMRTPGHDEELAAGFLLGESVVRLREQIARIDPCRRVVDGGVINVFLSAGVEVDFGPLQRNVYVSSSCGVCGKASIEAVRGAFEPVETSTRFEAAMLMELVHGLRRSQAMFDRTGGLHAAGLFDAAGKALVVREDVGRHNAVDKVLGHALLAGWLPLSEHVLMVSGRVSFEIVQKALSAGVPVIAAVSAPSSLAVELAHDAGQTLIGFLRPPNLNVYTHPRRIDFSTGVPPAPVKPSQEEAVVLSAARD